LGESPGGFRAWFDIRPPAASRELWPRLVRLLTNLHDNGDMEPARQVGQVRELYTPLLEEKYENPLPRLRDIEQLQQMALRFANRQALLADMALDPPATTKDIAGPSSQEEDQLILSTIHSAKGLEWDAVYVMHAADGDIPSHLALNSPQQIEEERRLFYVALTRAKSWLYVYFPQMGRQGWRGGYGYQRGYVQLTRFMTPAVKETFDCGVAGEFDEDDESNDIGADDLKDIRGRSRSMWS
jgi:DNA helicase-2/ATP-dependent DNA helicase PcrA